MDTHQIKIWESEFGDDYTDRNVISLQYLSARIMLWSKMLSRIQVENLDHILEVGANIGANLRALKNLVDAQMYSVEPNKKSNKILVEDNVVPKEHVHTGSIFDMSMFDDASMDLVFTSGVLIHVAPDDLKKATDEMMRVSKKYVACIEYFSHEIQEVNYRGQTSFLYKRDFGSFFLENYPDLRVVDYGFEWKPMAGLDNITWFIFEK